MFLIGQIQGYQHFSILTPTVCNSKKIFEKNPVNRMKMRQEQELGARNVEKMATKE